MKHSKIRFCSNLRNVIIIRYNLLLVTNNYSVSAFGHNFLENESDFTNIWRSYFLPIKNLKYVFYSNHAIFCLADC